MNGLFKIRTLNKRLFYYLRTKWYLRRKICEKFIKERSHKLYQKTLPIREQLNRYRKFCDENGITNSEVLSELESRDITHIYIGQQQGMVNNNAAPLLDINILRDDPRFSVVYNKDRVWIFEINHPEG